MYRGISIRIPGWCRRICKWTSRIWDPERSPLLLSLGIVNRISHMQELVWWSMLHWLSKVYTTNIDKSVIDGYNYTKCFKNFPLPRVNDWCFKELLYRPRIIIPPPVFFFLIVLCACMDALKSVRCSIIVYSGLHLRYVRHSSGAYIHGVFYCQRNIFYLKGSKSNCSKNRIFWKRKQILKKIKIIFFVIGQGIL